MFDDGISSAVRSTCLYGANRGIHLRNQTPQVITCQLYSQGHPHLCLPPTSILLSLSLRRVDDGPQSCPQLEHGPRLSLTLTSITCTSTLPSALLLCLTLRPTAATTVVLSACSGHSNSPSQACRRGMPYGTSRQHGSCLQWNSVLRQSSI